MGSVSRAGRCQDPSDWCCEQTPYPFKPEDHEKCSSSVSHRALRGVEWNTSDSITPGSNPSEDLCASKNDDHTEFQKIPEDAAGEALIAVPWKEFQSSGKSGRHCSSWPLCCLSRGGRKLFWTGRKPYMVHSVCVPPLDLAVEPLKNSVGQILAVLEGRKSFS